MILVFSPHDEDVKYEVTIKDKVTFVNTLKDADFLINSFDPPVKLLNQWFDMLQSGILILSPKHLKTSIYKKIVTDTKVLITSEVKY